MTTTASNVLDPSNVLDRVLVLEMVRVTEAAAIAASTLVGHGDEKAADAAAVEAMREALKTGADKEAAATVGKLVAERALAAGVEKVVFDRGPYLYHGRVKALADAAREGGLSF